MSVEAMATVLHHSQAAGTAKVVLIGIANHAGDGGAWPTIATLAKYARVSERSVQRAIRELEELGEIHVHDQAGGGRGTQDRYRPNRYDILITCPADCDRTMNHRCASDDVDETPEPAPEPATDRGDTNVTPQAETGVTSTSPLKTDRGDTSVASGVTPASPEPSYNHPETPQPPEPPPSTSCPIHPDGDGTRCRGCGTNPKAKLDQQRRDAAAAARAEARRQQLADRDAAAELRRRGPSPEAAADLERIRQQLAGAR